MADENTDDKGIPGEDLDLLDEGQDGPESDDKGKKGTDDGKGGNDDDEAARGEGETHFRDLIVSEDYKKEAERFTSLDDVFKSLKDLQKREGQIRVPGKDADEKQVKAFRKAIGVPDKPEDYTLPEIPEEDLTDDIKAWRQDWVKTFHDLGVPKTIGDSLIAKFAEDQVKSLEDQVAEDEKFAAEQDSILAKEWPGKQMDVNKGFANDAARALWGDDLPEVRKIELKNGRFLLDDARMLRPLAKLGREMQEGTPMGALTGDERDSAESELQEIRDKIKAAQNKGDNKTANKLYQQEQAMIAKMDGARPIVGAQGRAA